MANSQWLKAKRTTKKRYKQIKSEAMRLFLCVTQWRKAQHTKAYVSIYDASKVQKESIGTIYNN